MGKSEVHLGEMTADECREVVRICTEFYPDE
jgi:hypothetical protein